MQKPHILILAAGQGKRMHSSLPKILHPVLFRPMIHYVLDLARALPHESISLIVGHGEAAVREACASFSELNYVVQKEQKGTAHAVQMAAPLLSGKKGTVLILSGDVILLRKDAMETFLKDHVASGAACSLLSAKLSDPSGYGRVLRNDRGDVVGIREHADATEKERAITEINCGIYLFESEALFSALSKIQPANQQNEFYLTDAIEILVKEKKKIAGILYPNAVETMGINDRAALYDAQKILQTRINRALMLRGVTLENPENTFIDPTCEISADVSIESGCRLIRSQIEKGVRIEADSRIIDSKIAAHTQIKQGSYLEESEVGENCSIGPYAHLRPGSRLESKVKVGNFVEIKKSTLKSGAKASHLTYIGDAEIGRDVNVGCGFITCNYDGVKKHKTIIEDNVFIGSDCQTVAPVKIGRGSYVAAGTTVTEDAPPDSLVISRGKQITKPGYAKKYGRKDGS